MCFEIFLKWSLSSSNHFYRCRRRKPIGVVPFHSSVQSLWTTRLISIPAYSVTRFANISPLWQNYVSLCQLCEDLLDFWQNFVTTLATFCAIFCYKRPVRLINLSRDYLWHFIRPTITQKDNTIPNLHQIIFSGYIIDTAAFNLHLHTRRKNSLLRTFICTFFHVHTAYYLYMHLQTGTYSFLCTHFCIYIQVHTNFMYINMHLHTGTYNLLCTYTQVGTIQLVICTNIHGTIQSFISTWNSAIEWKTHCRKNPLNNFVNDIKILSPYWKIVDD